MADSCKFTQWIQELFLYLVVICLLNGQSVHSLSTSDVTKGFPAKSISCKQYNFTQLDCSWRILSDVPDFTDYEARVTTNLTLSHNRLAELTELPFQKCIALQELDLSHNSLSNISSTVFIGLSTLQKLDLRFNVLTVVQNGVFNDLVYLKYLYISSNHLKWIHEPSEPSPFVHMTLLEILTLGGNHIRFVNNNTFANLFNLKELYLGINDIETLPLYVFNDLKLLQFLDLSENKLRAPPNTVIAPLEALITLMLSNNNKFETCILGESFTKLTNLSFLGFDIPNPVLHCASTTFVYLPRQLQTLSFYVSPSVILESDIFLHVNSTSLKELNTTFPRNPNVLSSLHCQLEKIFLMDYSNLGIILTKDSFDVLSHINDSLDTLHMDKGNLQRIEGPAFRLFRNLSELLITSGALSYISPDAFEGLHYLRVLDLSNNKLNKQSGVVFGDLLSLKQLNLENNLFSNDFILDTMKNLHALEYLNLKGNKLYSLVCESSCPISIREINFSYMFNDVPSLTKNISVKQIFPFLKVLDIAQGESTSVNFPVPICDFAPNLQSCFMHNIRPRYNRSVSYDTLLKNALGKKCEHLVNLDISQTSANYLSVDLQPNISLPKLQTLNVAQNALGHLTNLSFISSTNLTKLVVKRNYLKIFEMIPLFDNLTELDLNENKIDKLDTILQIDTLKTLKIKGNLIRNISVQDIGKLQQISSLDISGNPFDCSCEILHFKKWLSSDVITYLINTYSNVEIRCASPDVWVGTSVTSLNIDCRSRVVVYISIAMSIGLLICLISVFAVRYRWHIKYKLFLLFRRQKYRNDIEADIEEIEDEDEIGINRAREYHAYISYDEDSVKDEGWVINELRVNLEEGPERFRLCIKGRDFIPGDSIVDSITEGIQKSRRTILILTQRFMESEWCYYETQMARMRLFHENRDVLTLILLEEIPDVLLTMSMRQLLCKKDCLKYPEDRAGQDLFWERLRVELKITTIVDRHNEP